MLLENILLLLDLIYYLSRGLMLPKEKKKTFIMTVNVVSCRSHILSFKGGNSTKREKKTFIITVVSEITRLTFIMTVVSCRSDLLSFKGGNSTKREFFFLSLLL